MYVLYTDHLFLRTVQYTLALKEQQQQNIPKKSLRGVSTVDEELEQLGTSFADKMAALAKFRRKQRANLLVTVPHGMEEHFMATIEDVGKDMVGYGGPDWTRNGRELGMAVKCGLLVDHHRKTGPPNQKG